MCCPQFSLKYEVDLDDDPGISKGSKRIRNCTDLWALIPMLLFMAVVIGSTIYCVKNSNMDLILMGSDDRGNICGACETPVEQKPYLYVTSKGKECVENCTIDGSQFLSNYCVMDPSLIPLSIDLLHYWKLFLILWSFWAAFTVLLFYIWIFVHKAMPYFGVVCTWVFCLVLVALLVPYSVFGYFSQGHLNLLPFIGIIIFLLVTSLYSNITSIFKMLFLKQLILETGRAMRNMPLLLLQPFFSSIIVTALGILALSAFIRVQTFTKLQQIAGKDTFDYVEYPIATCTKFLLIAAFVVFYELVKNFQSMLIGGCVAQWYFTQRDGTLSRPINKTFSNILGYHLGTLCCGSFVLPFVYVFRSILNAFRGAASRPSLYTCTCQFLFQIFAASVTCLDFYSRNAFIVTAMYGYNFCSATVRAHRLLCQNVFIASGYSIGDFSLLYTKFWLVFLAVTFGCGWMYFTETSFIHRYILVAVLAIFYTLLVELSVSMIDVAIDTLFLCFCEDCLYKSGKTKPYFMSTNMAQFVENTNQFLDPIRWKELAEQWEKGPKRVYSHENLTEEIAVARRDKYPKLYQMNL